MKIKWCPFCGNRYAYPQAVAMCGEDSQLELQAHRVACDCGAHGPERYGPDSKSDAVCAWNTRAREAKPRPY